MSDLSPILKSKMPLAVLEKTSEFRRLNVAQRFYIQTLLHGIVDLGLEDHLFSAQVAFESDSARVRSYAIRHSPKIQAVLRVYENYGKSARQRLLDQIQRELADAKPGSVARARLVAAYATAAFGEKPLKKIKKSNRRKS
jgi:hypothetical protein